ncbi:bifunctional adenosylcobinamide kinase/adenosylcobinamide-phosphate guanylyltransferase [Neobacillus sp. OS1-33]|uniref:bifunctional adenosylcobinamide kinase/adenosylcobinamide-phosphate guanylyltransferase n=1 Tax=Neobacillus sp. OS1-33 TaxID=3070683 RepID=UPI0027DF22A2|nr:bifunctional adenosylcobinamide kinase/adenosylcobinamide-phosphate guanylyltransferase [Neobacillus sp. OS1-33]WML27017.1 bifunctional adenosylcobinamide kinase/adenosylcobinamide-phosphate guanylyltransferase [Neobacillus sp. OS1-33]
MHFIIGGAFNGKRAWVKNYYKVFEHNHWISAYETQTIPKELNTFDQDLLVIEGVEIWLKNLSASMGADKCRVLWANCLDNWLTWEKAALQRQLVVIGTDITKGIVPIEAENRLWRDITGWAYQDTAAKSEKVDVIWYGLNQTIK